MSLFARLGAGMVNCSLEKGHALERIHHGSRSFSPCGLNMECPPIRSTLAIHKKKPSQRYQTNCKAARDLETQDPDLKTWSLGSLTLRKRKAPPPNTGLERCWDRIMERKRNKKKLTWRISDEMLEYKIRSSFFGSIDARRRPQRKKRRTCHRVVTKSGENKANGTSNNQIERGLGEYSGSGQWLGKSWWFWPPKTIKMKMHPLAHNLIERIE
jgi:hypothetical protein